MGDNHYRVKNWDRFQHYHKPRPAWIKLHRSLLDDIDFQSLSTRSRALLVMLWLIAAESDDGTIPAAEAIAWRLRLPVREVSADIRTLTHYLEPLYSESRGSLASDREETERETETEREARTREDKVAFSPRVLMTQAEHAALVEAHGTVAVSWMIQKLDSHIEAKGTKYKSHAAAIRSWVVDAYAEHLKRNGTGAACSPAQRDKFAHLEETA